MENFKEILKPYSIEVKGMRIFLNNESDLGHAKTHLHNLGYHIKLDRFNQGFIYQNRKIARELLLRLEHYCAVLDYRMKVGKDNKIEIHFHKKKVYVYLDTQYPVAPNVIAPAIVAEYNNRKDNITDNIRLFELIYNCPTKHSNDEIALRSGKPMSWTRGQLITHLLGINELEYNNYLSNRYK